MSFDKPSQMPPQAAAETVKRAVTMPPDVQASIDTILRNFTGKGPSEAPALGDKELAEKFADDPELFAVVRGRLQKEGTPGATWMIGNFEQRVQRSLKMSVRGVLEDMVKLCPKPDEDEEDEDSVKQLASTLVKELMGQDEGLHAEALQNLRKKIETYQDDVRRFPEDRDSFPQEFAVLADYDFDTLLKLLPRNPAILKEVAAILEMPVEQAREELEMGE